jgi:exodeoxyribonuclease VII small subunit
VTEPDPNADAASPSFEQALAELDAIVHDLEEGQTSLAEALARYEQGVGLLKQCYGLLERAERRIELLTGVDAQGNPVTEPFDDQATMSLEEKAQARSKRRSEPGGGRRPPRGSTRQGPQSEGPANEIDEGEGLF